MELEEDCVTVSDENSSYIWYKPQICSGYPNGKHHVFFFDFPKKLLMEISYVIMSSLFWQKGQTLLVKGVNLFWRKRLTSFRERGYTLLAKEVFLFFIQKRLTSFGKRGYSLLAEEDHLFRQKRLT